MTFKLLALAFAVIGTEAIRVEQMVGGPCTVAPVFDKDRNWVPSQECLEWRKEHNYGYFAQTTDPSHGRYITDSGLRHRDID